MIAPAMIAQQCTARSNAVLSSLRAINLRFTEVAATLDAILTGTPERVRMA
jgi:hypothetical protein